LLERTEIEKRYRSEDNKEIGGKEEEELENAEISNAIKRMKLKKAAGIGEIPMEAWKSVGVGLKKELIELLRMIEKRRFRQRRKSIVVPLYWIGEKVSSYFNAKMKQVFFIF